MAPFSGIKCSFKWKTESVCVHEPGISACAQMTKVDRDE